MTTAVLEIADEPLNGGYPWLIRFSHGREEVGIAGTYVGAIQDLRDALLRERIATGVYAHDRGIR